MVEGIKAILTGMGITFKHFLQNVANNKFTVQYPFQKKELPPRARWALGLQGRCVACQLCEAICPTEAIYIEGVGKDGSNRTAGVWLWDSGRCMYCGLCVEACPEEVIVMTNLYELATDDRSNLVWNKQRLYKAKKEVFGPKPTFAWMGFYRRLKDMGKAITLPGGFHKAWKQYIDPYFRKKGKGYYQGDREKRFLLEEEKPAAKTKTKTASKK
ncbi:MAG: NADH-quinone oxidoreductase subunit I [Thermotogae bacterium]|nr:NADH-quinone oxidoreductase subunit I [Thermotogota bacterium]